MAVETEKLKQSVLVDLRSVIQSCKGGVPLNRLQDDYKSLIGTTIPFTSLGYSSLETFLQSIPQVIKLKKISDRQTIVEAVADSTTSHLQNLISKQRNARTRKCSVKRYGRKPSIKQKSSSCPNCASSKSTLKEIEALKSKLDEQKQMNSVLESRVNQLLSESEPNLEDEKMMIHRFKYQIGLLHKRILPRQEESPQASHVIKKINEIIEIVEDLDTAVGKLILQSTKVNSSSVPDENLQQVPKNEPVQLYQQQCKETEELKKQVELQNSQIQNMDGEMKSQFRKLRNRIKNNLPKEGIPSKEGMKSELVEDSENKLQEQIQNVEKNMTLELLKLKKLVETEYSEHIVKESGRLKKFEKELKAQKSHAQSMESKMQLQLQKLKNKVDAIDMNNLADMMVKKFLSGGMIKFPQVYSTSSNCERYVPPHRRTQQSNEKVPSASTSSTSTDSAELSEKKEKSKSEPETSEMTASVTKPNTSSICTV